MGADGEKGRLFEPFPALLINEAHDLPAHARVPKALQVTRHGFEHGVAIGLRLEEGSDLVDHLHQLVRVHVGLCRLASETPATSALVPGEARPERAAFRRTLFAMSNVRPHD